jgi:hypothetical protein
MGTELALYWSLLSRYTSSVIKAYFLPLRGVLGAGEGGRSWPSRSSAEGALPLEPSPAMVFTMTRIAVLERNVAASAWFSRWGEGSQAGSSRSN